MKCPNCGSENNNVYFSNDRYGYRRRNRRCADCDFGFSTVEVTVYPHRMIQKITIDYVGGERSAFECLPGTSKQND